MAGSSHAAAKTVREKAVNPSEARPRKKLNQWLATGICGNDITSSCLYVSAIAAGYSGAMAPLVLLLVCLVLFLYRKVYTEVVEALPLNGGAYNCLLNCTSKFSASLAACLTILSYIATAVISSKTAIEYLHSLLGPMPVIEGTIGVLAIFAALTILGITESAIVALCIFVFHITTLTVFCVLGIAHLPTDFHLIRESMAALPSGSSLIITVYLGFSAALLGISGFESSANFVEEQAEGVFRLTLRNMWVAVTIFNPLVSVLSLNLMPLSEIIDHKDHLLAVMARQIGGGAFHVWMVLDASLVLSGAVLTSYVGVTGLVQRMALDQCLPQFLLKRNRRGTAHRIIVVYFLLCSSILLVTGGKLLSLAGVYTISFLGVMTLFGLGNLLLKIRRRELKRTYRAGVGAVILAMAATSLGIVGNIKIDYRNFLYFMDYFIPTVLVVVIMYLRIPILRLLLELVNVLMTKILVWRTRVIDQIMALTEQKVILFIRSGRLDRLFTAFQYIMKNESSRHIVLIHLYNKPEENDERAIRESLESLQKIFSSLHVELVVKKGQFGPQIIDNVSKQYGVAKNNIFIGAPEAKHPFSIQDLGGVRVIF